MNSVVNAQKYELEICIDSLDSAIAAQECGAHRVELCARLDLDGLTPETELIRQCRYALNIGLHVIIRPRSGDFTATEKEVSDMLNSIETCKQIGVNGVVIGVLKSDGSLNVQVTEQLIRAARPMSVTFHRAFDVCANPLKTLQQLINLKVDRLLTSGQADKAINGVGLISELVKSSDQRIGIMAGSGVNSSNIPKLWNAGVREFHFTSHQKAIGHYEYDSDKTLQAVKILDSLSKESVKPS